MPNLDEALLNRLRSNDPTLTDLDLANTNLSTEDTYALSEALKINQRLTHLDLGRNKLSAAGARALSDALRVNQTLTSLDLWSNNLSAAGIAALSEALKINQTLTSLDLHDNNLSAAGAAALSEALKVNHTLMSLDLRWNKLSDTGTSALSEALKVNQTLTSLNLNGSNLSAEDARALSEALIVNKTLTSLDLGNNNLGATGAAALSEALKINQTLTSLGLYENKLSDAGAAALSEALKINQTLTSLDLGSNELNETGTSPLSEALKVNQTLTSLGLSGNSLSDAFKNKDAFRNKVDMFCQRNTQLHDRLFEAIAQGDMGQVKEALQAGVSRLARDGKDNSLLHAAVLAYQPDIARYLLAEMTKVHTNPLSLVNYEGKTSLALAQEGQYTAIVHLFTPGNVAPTSITTIEALLKAAQDYQANQAYKEAIAAYEKILEKEPKYLKALLGKGLVYEAQGKLDRAKRYYERAVSKNKRSDDTVSLAQAKERLAALRLQVKERKLSIDSLPPKPPAKAAPPMAAVALYDYQAQRPDEISFKAGDTLLILEQKLGGWWRAEVNGQQGVIPSNYVELIIPLPLQPQPVVNPDTTGIGTLSDEAPAPEPSKPKAPVEKLSINITLDYADLKFTEFEGNPVMLGQGAYGTVYRGTYHGSPVAIKELNTLDEKALNELVSEVSVMKSVHSPRIVQCYGMTTSPYTLVMEYLAGGTLFSYLNNPKKTVNWKFVYQIALDISYGMDYLHKQNIVHGDLKSANVLLDKEGQAKLADFGNAKVKTTALNTLSTTKTLFGQRVGGTPNYLAPELWQELEVTQTAFTGFSEQAKTTRTSDMYSLGLLFWETTTRQAPFQRYFSGITQVPLSEFKALIIEKGLQETPNPKTPPRLKEVMQHCWFKAPTKRPVITHVLNEIKTEANHLPVDFANTLIPK